VKINFYLIIYYLLNVQGHTQSCFLEPETFHLEKFETIEERFKSPEGFQRIKVDSNNFAAWLRQVPLLPKNSAVKDYRNRIFKKSDDSTVATVVAYNIKGRNLDQCMDILQRLWTEFLIAENRSSEIQFPLPDGLVLSWNDWAKGNRPKFRGLNFFLEKIAAPDSSARNFKKYLNTIFEYSGTQTFYHHYANIPAHDLRIGDFIVKKGYKGHAVIFLDLVEDANGNKRALIGQGDTPACQLYLLSYKKDDSWFPIDVSTHVLPLPIKKKMSWDGLRRF